MTNGSNSTSSSSSDPSKTPEPELCGGTTGFIMMIMIFFTIFIMFNPDLRITIANSLDGVFNPIFGFEGKYPVITLLTTAIFLVFCSTTIRHVMTDWVGIAKAQKFMNAYNKERMDAMTSGNTVKLKKLEELTPEITKNNMMLMASNFKPVVFTMIFFIIVFPWIWVVYIENLEFTYITLPGYPTWDILAPMDWCIIPWGNWILVYILLSFPIGFLIQNGLKFITFKYKIKQTEINEERKIDEKISDLEERMIEVKESGVQTSRAQELMTQARQNLEEKKYSRASDILDETGDHLDQKLITQERITGLIKQAEVMIKNADKKGIRTDEAMKSLDFSRKAMKRKDETSAIYYAKQSQRQIKEFRKQHRDAEESLSTVKALMYDLRELNTEEADTVFESAKSAMEKKEYSDVIKQIKATKHKAEEISNLYNEAQSAVNSVKNSLETIRHLELEVPKAKEIFENAEEALNEHRYAEAIDFAKQCDELITKEREKFQSAQESVSFAKLVISNAISFGANVYEAEKLAANAEMALSQKDYERAIELADSAKNIAETAKRQQQRLGKRK